MDREEAKNILQLCRPNNLDDRNDPLIAEALELLREDTELSVWFEEQQAIDTVISAEFCKIEASAHQQASTLVAMKAHAAHSILLQGDSVDQTTDQVEQSLPFPANTRPWSRPWIAAAAALVVAGAFLAVPRQTPHPQLVSNDMVATEPTIATAGVPNVIHFLAEQIRDFNLSRFDKRADEVSELQSHLAGMGMPTPAHIPEQLEALKTLGCITFDYNGMNLSMICFKNGRAYHLITAEKASFPKECSPCEKQKTKSYECDKQAFKIWSEGEQIFILTTTGTQEDIPKLPEFI